MSHDVSGPNGYSRALGSGSDAITPQEIQQSLALAQKWVEQQRYRGYEPFDGLSSWLRPLACGDLLAERLVQQLIRQCPLNLRPALGVKPQDSTKGRGYMASGYVMRYRVTKQQEYLDKAIDCLEWLDKHKVARFRHHSWSNHFDFVSRGGRYTKDDPIIVWTALIGHAYIEAFEVTGNEWFLRIADSVCNWILDLPREKTERGDCISYLAHVQSSIHNANMLGAGVLARTAKHTGSQECRRVARLAMEYSCSRQRPDGAWWYAENAVNHWIDNFHTGYNLDGLKHYTDATGDESYRQNFEKGLAFYKANFFEQSGRPKYYLSRTYPVDIQCSGQAIDTLAFVSEDDPESLALAKLVAAWTIRNMQDRKGYFYYRQYPILKAKTPMLHWGQGTMFKALAHLLLRVASTKQTSRV
jgi:rhamnogalacturonyl hydrolase YesR